MSAPHRHIQRHLATGRQIGVLFTSRQMYAPSSTRLPFASGNRHSTGVRQGMRVPPQAGQGRSKLKYPVWKCVHRGHHRHRLPLDHSHIYRRQPAV